MAINIINRDYIIDISANDYSGGYCDFLPIKNHSELGFKAFKKKYRAVMAWKNQKLLSEFDLAPKPITKVCRIYYDQNHYLSDFWPQDHFLSNWGFVTEKASPVKIGSNNKICSKIQKLVDTIQQKTNMKFWDCHELNIGYIKRGRYKKLVCIDTGKESFEGYANAWGNSDPGPRCSYCNKFNCKCED